MIKRNHAPRCGISILRSASACVLLLELHSYAHDAMLERRDNFIIFPHLECLLLGRVFTIGLLGNFKALLQELLAIKPMLVVIFFLDSTYLSRIKNSLDLLEQATLVLLEHRVGFHGLLYQELNIPQLAEVEVALALQSLHSLQQLCVLRLERCVRGTTASGLAAGCSRCT